MLGDGLQALNGETYHKFTAQQFARQATKLDNGIQIMATTTGHLEQFPGAYSGTGAAWERKAKEAIGLLPDRHGFSPSVVLGPKPPDTIMAEAKPVPQEERQQWGRNYIGVMIGKTVTPRKLAKSLNTPLRTAPTRPYQGWDQWDQEEEEEEEQDDANARR